MIETCHHVQGYRRICQDAVGIFPCADGVVIVVADGAGGTNDGEAASRDVVAAIRESATADRGPSDWAAVLRQIDHGIPLGQSTACVVVLDGNGMTGASVGYSRVAILVEDTMIFPTDGQVRKPLLGTGAAEPRSFRHAWSGEPVIVASDGLWNAVPVSRLSAELRFIDFPVLAKTLAAMTRLPSGAFADDVAVVCARRRRPFAAQQRIDLLADS
jgi:hypothetical protein